MQLLEGLYGWLYTTYNWTARWQFIQLQTSLQEKTTITSDCFESGEGWQRYLWKTSSIPLILIILFSGVTAGNTTIADCWLWGLHNKKWLTKYVGLPHGLPDERTLARTIAKTDIDSLVAAFLRFQRIIYGYIPEGITSFDGKTLNGVHGKDVIKHMLSLFTHESHQIIGQIGVTQKENEIPAFHRLLLQVSVVGMLLVGDALHTQKDTIHSNPFASRRLFAVCKRQSGAVSFGFKHVFCRSLVWERDRHRSPAWK